MSTKLLAISNAVVLLATLAVNFLANWLPIAGRTTGELSDLYPNLFVPAGFTFSIRGVIYLLLIGFVIRQLIDTWSKHTLGVTEKIGPRFLISCLANMSWIYAWHQTRVGLSVLIMIVLLISLIIISNHVKTGTKRGGRTNKLFTQVPFGVYLGRISVATIANISTYLVDTGRGMRGMSEIFRTVIVLIVATALGIIQLRRSANIPFALVLLWAFFGIVSKRLAVDPVSASTIIWTIARCSLLLSGFIGWRAEQWWNR